ncbi:DUF3219 family protein [Bacillus sp. FJAT-42376]|uniref:DUF3219 family protein n=1 Tax=Bacillus sp. FJAT-42376 TaxID=2014076 RepID=UPI001F14DA69|nr:DUF3219 family protein [Bacillus sp. FJAT-42376]
MKVYVNDRLIEAADFVHERENGRHIIRFHFKVKSGADYHDTSTLLYQNDFAVKVPDKNLSFQAIIKQYSTSADNLYEENAVGDYFLQLIEKKAGN